MINPQQSVYLAYHPIAIQLTECTENSAASHEQTFRKVELAGTSPVIFSFRYTLDELQNIEVMSGRRLVWTRLPNIVQQPLGTLFPQFRHSSFNEKLFEKIYPSFFAQIGLLPSDYYQSIFTSVTFNPTGIYTVIAQVNGHYKVVTIDDWIPVYERTNKPLWDMETTCPWAILLLKAWALINGGYQTLINCHPYEFIRTFTYPNWKLRVLKTQHPDSLYEDLRTMLPSDARQPGSNLQSSIASQQQSSSLRQPPQNQSFIQNPSLVRGLENNVVIEQITITPNITEILQNGMNVRELPQQSHITNVNILPAQPIGVIPVNPIPESKIFNPPGSYVPPLPLSLQPFPQATFPQPPQFMPSNQLQPPPRLPSPAGQPSFNPRSFPPSSIQGNINTMQFNPIRSWPPTTEMPRKDMPTIMSVREGSSIGNSLVANQQMPVFPSFMPYNVVNQPNINTAVANQQAVFRNDQIKILPNPILTNQFPPHIGQSIGFPNMQYPNIRNYKPAIQQTLNAYPPIGGPPPVFATNTEPSTYTQIIRKTEIVQPQQNPLVMHSFGDGMLRRSSAYGNNSVNFTVIAKTKDNDKLYQYGLMPNCAGYRIVRSFQVGGEVLLKIQTSANHDWNGRYSVYDAKLNNLNNVKQLGLTLRKSFIITYGDFLNLFSHIIVSSIDYTNIVGVKHIFTKAPVQSHLHQSKHFYLRIDNPCVLDMSLVQIGNCIKEQIRQNVMSKRFLKAKIIVARQRELEGRSVSLADMLIRQRVDQSARNPTSNIFKSKINNNFGQGSNNSSNLKDSQVSIRIKQGAQASDTVINVWQNVSQGTQQIQENVVVVGGQNTMTQMNQLQNQRLIFGNQCEYMLIKQTSGLCQNETFQGLFNKGEYIIHVKCQPHIAPYEYMLHVVSSFPVQLKEVFLTKEEKSLMLRSTIMDYCKRVVTNKQFLTNERRLGHCDWVIFKPSYEDFGYGFVAFMAEEYSHNKVICRFNPARLMQEGFICKDIYKNRTDEIELESSRGNGHVIILKRTQDSLLMPSSIQLFFNPC